MRNMQPCYSYCYSYSYSYPAPSSTYKAGVPAHVIGSTTLSLLVTDSDTNGPRTLPLPVTVSRLRELVLAEIVFGYANYSAAQLLTSKKLQCCSSYFWYHAQCLGNLPS
jgi:hypothetical protein